MKTSWTLALELFWSHTGAVQVRLLGDVQLLDDDKVIEISALKVRWLLAALALRCGQVCAAAEIIDTLWDQDPPTSAPNLVQGYVSALRKLVGADRIRTMPGGYLLNLDPGDVDALVFRREAGVAKALVASDSGTGGAALSDVLGLWGGVPFGAKVPDGRLLAMATSLEELRLELVDLRVGLDLDRGQHVSLVSELEELVLAHPYREGFVNSLAISLYRSGRQADALRRIENARERLLDDLGLSVGAGLAELEQQILNQTLPLDRQQTVNESSIDQSTHSQLAASQQTAGHLRSSQRTASHLPSVHPRSVHPRSVHPRSNADGQPGAAVLVGRESELARLKDRLGSVDRGEQCTIFVGGEPGIGKSAIAGYLSWLAMKSGHQVLLGRCDDHVAAPYRPFVEVILDALGRLGPESATKLVRPRLRATLHVVPSVAPLLDAEEPSESDAIKLSLLDRFDTLRWLLREISQEETTLIVLEDIHWADSATIRFLHYLATGGRLPGVLILATHRSTEDGEVLRDVLADLRSKPAVERMYLRGLDLDALAELLRQQPGDSIEPDLVDWIYSQTDGNPFLACEVMSHIVETGSRSGIPDSVVEVVGRRLRRLSESGYRTLEYAAVLGESGSLSMLRALAADIEDLSDAVGEVTVQGIFADEDLDDHAYRFEHAIFRSAVLNEMTSLARQDLHLAAANMWSESGLWSQRTRSAELNLQVASHLFAAGGLARADRAFDAYMAVGAEADSSGAKIEAVMWYDRALALLADDDPRHRGTRLTKFVAAQAAWHWLHGDTRKA